LANKYSLIKIEKNELFSKLDAALNKMKNMEVEILSKTDQITKYDENNLNLNKENEIFDSKLKEKCIEIEKLTEKLEQLSSEYTNFQVESISTDLHYQDLNEQKNEFKKTLNEKKEEYLKNEEQMQHVIKKNKQDYIKKLSQYIENMKINSKIKTVKTQEKPEESENNKRRSYRVFTTKNNSLNVKKKLCVFPNCDGKGNSRNTDGILKFKTHSSIKFCPKLKNQKPHSKEQLKESVHANKIHKTKQKNLHDNELQSLKDKLVFFEVIF